MTLNAKRAHCYFYDAWLPAYLSGCETQPPAKASDAPTIEVDPGTHNRPVGRTLPLWRGSLLPLGCAAVAKPVPAVYLAK
ncbi:Hypothetical protein PSEBR_m846 [Pseudomonas brassicacearum subsp. brassicacearum NFM421]|uniref:Uncharacterized protein n=1 Tax=Pseudomonas brassicacearum (strain NFM421) TaxID=994484 RepID=F2KFY1_PSEBN|nr:Hypothetical protein PSEBR_m846 [Pseudomonas brassicacearum subsp. brassicacearum NFM421]